MAFALVTVHDATVNGTKVEAAISVETDWGKNYSDHLSADSGTTSPAQAVTGIKNRVIALAAADGHTITAGNVYVLGGPQ